MGAQLAASIFLRLLHHVQHGQYKHKVALANATQGTSHKSAASQELYDSHPHDRIEALDGFAPLNVGPSSNDQAQWRNRPWGWRPWRWVDDGDDYDGCLWLWCLASPNAYCATQRMCP